MIDIIGNALLDFNKGMYNGDIKTYSSLNEEGTMPLPYLFRGFSEMPDLERKALKRCYGSVLDIGCGSGSHSLYLQNKGFEVTALDRSNGAVQVCKDRGILKTLNCSVLDHEGPKYDTLLLLMNGIGIAGDLNSLNTYLNHFKKLLRSGGQVLLDSSDIIYMYDQDDDGGYWIPDDCDYYGEVLFEMEYKGKRGKPFKWLYIDYQTLKNCAENHNFNCEYVSEGPHYDYLAKLTLKQY